jgi:hypothetical protein
MNNKQNNETGFTDNLNQFLNGGESTYAKAGVLTGKFIMKTTKVLSLIVIAIAVVSASQCTQYSASIDGLRELKLSEWESKGNTYKLQVDSFKDNCQSNSNRTFEQIREAPYSYYDCATKYGSRELSEHLKSATDSIVVSAPLAWL